MTHAKQGAFVRKAFTPQGTLHISYQAQVEIEDCIIDTETGVAYIPIPGPSIGGVIGASPTSTPTTEKVSATTKEATTEKVDKYDEADLKAMDVKELLKICDKLSINPEDTEGKNTNKKLRDLILDAQESDDEEEEEEEEKPKKSSTKESSKKGNNLAAVIEVFTDLDDEETTPKKARVRLIELGLDEDNITTALKKAEKDDEISCEELAEIAMGGDSETAPTKPSAKGKKENPIVDISTLEKGDEIEVAYDEKGKIVWYSGVVTKVKGDEVTVTFDEDDSVVILDDEDEVRMA